MVVRDGEFRISLHTDREGTVEVQGTNEYMRTEPQKRWESIQIRVYRTGRLEPRAFRLLRGGNRVCVPKLIPHFALISPAHLQLQAIHSQKRPTPKWCQALFSNAWRSLLAIPIWPPARCRAPFMTRPKC